MRWVHDSSEHRCADDEDARLRSILRLIARSLLYHDLGAVPVLRSALTHARHGGHVSADLPIRNRGGWETHLERLNEGLAMAGFKSKKFEKVRRFDSNNYEKLTFLGH